MTFYVRQHYITPFMIPCPKCGNKNDVSLGQTACFRCGAQLPEQELCGSGETEPSAKALVSAMPLPVAPDSIIRHRVRNHLALVRANTCYRVLRGLIDVVFGLAVFLVGGCLLEYLGIMSREHDENWILYTVGWSISGILVIVILIAARQSALLLIDIADTLLYEHSKDDA